MDDHEEFDGLDEMAHAASILLLLEGSTSQDQLFNDESSQLSASQKREFESISSSDESASQTEIIVKRERPKKKKKVPHQWTREEKEELLRLCCQKYRGEFESSLRNKEKFPIWQKVMDDFLAKFDIDVEMTQIISQYQKLRQSHRQNKNSEVPDLLRKYFRSAIKEQVKVELKRESRSTRQSLSAVKEEKTLAKRPRGRPPKLGKKKNSSRDPSSSSDENLPESTRSAVKRSGSVKSLTAKRPRGRPSKMDTLQHHPQNWPLEDKLLLLRLRFEKYGPMFDDSRKFKIWEPVTEEFQQTTGIRATSKQAQWQVFWMTKKYKEGLEHLERGGDVSQLPSHWNDYDAILGKLTEVKEALRNRRKNGKRPLESPNPEAAGITNVLKKVGGFVKGLIPWKN